MDPQALIDEFTGKTARIPRTAAELEAAYGTVIGALLEAETWPGVRGSPKPILQEIIVRAGGPGAEAERGSLERAMVAALERATDLNARVFLLRELVAVGREHAVPALAKTLSGDDAVPREYALRALERNPSPQAGQALVTALDKARDRASRLSLAGALGRRREKDAVEALAKLLGEGNRDVAEAALMAIASIGTPAAATALMAAAAAPPPALGTTICHAFLLCAERLARDGDADAPLPLCKGVFARATEGFLRIAALRIVARTKPDLALPHIVELMKAGDARVQAEAARLALELPKEGAEKLRKEMPNLPPEAQARLTEALAERRDT